MEDRQLDPAEALAMATGARRRIAERGQVWWYHPVTGIAIAGQTASLALPAPIIGTIVFLLLVVFNFTAWQRRTGLGPIHHNSRTLRVVIPLALTIMGGFLLTFVLHQRFDADWIPLLAAPILGVIAGIGSRAVDRAWGAQSEDA